MDFSLSQKFTKKTIKGNFWYFFPLISSRRELFHWGLLNLPNLSIWCTLIQHFIFTFFFNFISLPPFCENDFNVIKNKILFNHKICQIKGFQRDFMVRFNSFFVTLEILFPLLCCMNWLLCLSEYVEKTWKWSLLSPCKRSE